MYKHGFHISDHSAFAGTHTIAQDDPADQTPPHGGEPGFQGEAQRAALLDANLVRFEIRWRELEPNMGSLSTTYVDALKTRITQGRVYNPALRGIGTLTHGYDDVPDWVRASPNFTWYQNGTSFGPGPGGAASGRFCIPNNWAGRVRLGWIFVAALVGNLQNEFHALELHNEPNITFGGGIPGWLYGQAAAKVLADMQGWGFMSRVLVGGASADHETNAAAWLDQMRAQIQADLQVLRPGDWSTINSQYRISCHCYPVRYGQSNPDQTGNAAGSRVFSRLDNVWSHSGQGARKIWLTETSFSSRWANGESEQSTFASGLHLGLGFRTWVEGACWWPLNDNTVAGPGEADIGWDQNANLQFHKHGVVKHGFRYPETPQANTDYKQAANTLRDLWTPQW